MIKSLWVAIIALAGVMIWQLFFQDHHESTQLGALQQSLDKMSATLTIYDQQFQSIKEHSNQMVAGIKELDTVVRGDSQTWRLMQVQNYLEMAMVQASLLNDTSSAINLLAAAENSMRQINNPNLIPVRKALQADIAMLASHPDSNVATIILRLTGIIDQIPNLPHKARIHEEFSQEEKTLPPENPDWGQRLSTAWQEIKSLIRIQRHDQPVTPYFLKDDISLINENLSLVLEQASFAAAQHYQELYSKELAHAQDWLHQYYDLQDPAVEQALQTLDEISKLPVATQTNIHLKTVDAWDAFVKNEHQGAE